MHEELQKDYDRRLLWARSLGIGADSDFSLFNDHSHHARRDCDPGWTVSRL